MKFLKLVPILIICYGFFPHENLLRASTENPDNYKVLSTNNKKLSIDNVE